MLVALVAKGAGGQQMDHRPQALTTTTYNIRADLIDEHDLGTQAGLDAGIDLLHVGSDKLVNGVNIHQDRAATAKAVHARGRKHPCQENRLKSLKFR